jgi:ABC-type glycerol-3-phosphate transport system permease component
MKHIPKIIVWSAILLASLLMVLPFYWMFATSVMETKQIMAFPPKFLPAPIIFNHFNNVSKDVPFGIYYRNSLLIAGISVCLSTFLGLLAGYAFAIYKFPLKNFFFIMILSTIMVPFQVTSVALYIFLAKFNAIDTYFGVLAPNLASALGVFLIRQGIQSVPLSLIEAARIDGSGEIRIIFQIIAPTIKTTMVTVALILFINSWNDFLWPIIVINSVNLRTIPIGLSLFKDPYGNIAFGPLMAATVISVVPMLLVYAFTQKYMIRGIALSGMKS